MFIIINDIITNKILHINTTKLVQFSKLNEVDKTGITHYLIIYNLTNNVLLKEEFSSDELRQIKLNNLNNLIG